MKNIMLLMLLLTFTVCSAQENNKKVETLTLTVKGNCEQCKERIENAADIKGVKVATWDEKTQILTVTYKPAKVSPEKIKKAILKSGHDLEEEKAGDEAYKKLPNCCKFRDNKCEK